MQIPYEVTARRDTGLYNAKIGIWLFLASEVMLFGGLFSAYVFLRIGITPGVDNPWPSEVQNIPIGFVNTLVLIASSVFVVLAWVQLKMRNWFRFQLWMAAVILCALTFLGLKSVEYYGKFHHHGLKFTDNSLAEGIVQEVDGIMSDKIRFEGKSITFDISAKNLYCLKAVHGDLPVFKAPDGAEVTDPASWAAKKYAADVNAAKKAYKEALAEEKKLAKEEGREIDESKLPSMDVDTVVTLEAAEPFLIASGERMHTNYTDKTITFRDGSKVTGSLAPNGDTVVLEVHEIDMQRVPLDEQKESMIWSYVADEGVKKGFFDLQNKYKQHLIDYYGSEEKVPLKQKQNHRINIHHVHAHHEHAEHGAEGEAAHGEAAHHGDPEGDGAGGAESSYDYPVIEVPRSDIKFIGNHGPRYNTYYAIYFTMTGLHGLHVIGGALVLGYFMLFGKKLFLRNPEHMANRVEVGGLFWHFVDLVWIFLFPVMYLF